MQHVRSVVRDGGGGHPRVRRPFAGTVLLGLLLFTAACSPRAGAAADPADPATGAATDAPAPALTGADAEPAFEILHREMVDGVEQAYVRYPSGDLMVTGWLFVNPFSEQDVEPCIVFNHGGVSGVTEGTRTKARWLAQRGFVVFAPSYRGEDDSEGEIEVAMGEVDDVLAAIDELAKHPGVQPDRFVLVGTSHGALVSVKAATRPELCGRLRGVVAAYGVMDIYTWYQYLLDNDFDVSDPLSRRIYGDGPADRPQAFADRHALNHLDTLCDAPILVVQGSRDVIVPEAQARILAAELAGRGRGQDRLEIYPIGEHGFLFWDDPERRSPEQLAEAERAWEDILAFVRDVVGDEVWSTE